MYVYVEVANGLPAIHLSSSNPNLLSVDMAESGLSVDICSQSDRLQEQFYHQAKEGKLIQVQLIQCTCTPAC